MNMFNINIRIHVHIMSHLIIISPLTPHPTNYSVNYRGSTGFGQDSIMSLIGQIGNQDVKDIQVGAAHPLVCSGDQVIVWVSVSRHLSVVSQRAVLTVLQSDPTLDPNRLAVIGGSHGGFLSCHLVGQYPDFYRACAARNPVINAATLLGTSDIVDWWDKHTRT